MSSNFFSKLYIQQIKAEQAKKDRRTIRVGDSIDKAEIVLGLCEGEIEGLADGGKSFYVNDTALKNQNGDDNFVDFDLEVYKGSGDAEEKLNYFLGGSARSTSVGITLSSGVPVVRQTQTGDLDFIEIRLVIASLMNVGDDGTSAASVEVKIEWKAVSETEWHHPNIEDNEPYILRGKITNNTVQEFRIPTERIDEPYEIRITKITADGNNTSKMNTIQWESFQEGFNASNSYPNTALAHIYLQYSDQITSIPSLSGIYKLTKIRIPSNYDPINHTYDGEWDGTFKKAWSDNPAWCLYDFVMNDRYGVNAFSPTYLDKWDCYEAGQWCDELVPDGKGGTEPRYTCNLFQTEATNGREFAVYLASLFNGVLVEPATGYLRLFVEKDADAVYLFTPENVTEAGFSYSFTAPETRYNDIKVSFTNPNLNWEADTRRVYNQDDININGRVTYDFAAVGCIREGEAMRRACYKLITATTEIASVSFVTNRQAQSLSNFDIILIADPVLGYSLPGRIKSVSEDRKTVYLRDSIYLEAGIPYKIQFNTPDGLYENELDPLTGSGSLKQFTLKDALPENLPEAAAFTISGSNKSGTPKPFRIMSISEMEGNPDQYSITALELNRAKWEASDNFLTEAAMADYSNIPSAAEIPNLLDASFYLSYNKRDLQSELTITPYYDESYPYYSGRLAVYSKGIGEDTWTQREVVGDNIIVDHPAGEYQFKILPISILGNKPSFETAPIFTYTVEDVRDYPSNVKNLQAQRSVNGVQLTWDPVTDIDLAGYEIRKGSDWDTGEVITTDLYGTSFYTIITDSSTQHYMVCAKNYLGYYSPFPAYISSTTLGPDDVPAFYATVSLDRVRFDWTQVEGTDIRYEIRQGDNWSTALKVASVNGNNTTVLLPSVPDITYCIKALSPTGLYSVNPRYTKPDMLLAPDRNVIIQVDNGKEGFPGITHGFEPMYIQDSETGEMVLVEETLIMEQEVTRAEHYFPVVLQKETRARNWLETYAFANTTRLKWEDLHYRYSQTEAHISWIGSQSLDSEGEVEAVIMKYSGIDSYEGLMGFPYNESTTDLSGDISPTYANTITYADGYFTKGLLLQPETRLDYEQDIIIPDTFNLIFKVKLDNTSSENVNFITLVGSQKRNYVKLYSFNGKLYCRFSDHKNLVVDYRHAKALDFLTIGISQTQSERTLYFFSDYGNFETMDTLEATPTGGFNKFYINKKLGESL